MNEVDYSPKRYSANGTTKEFPFDWKVFEDSDLVIKLIDSSGTETTCELGVDYTASVESMGGNVVFTTAPETGYTVEISRATSQYQSTGYSTSIGFQGSEIEKSFDKVSCNLQEMEYSIETFKEDFTEEINETISTFKEDINTQIAENKTEIEAEVEEFESEVNSNLTQVYNAVEQLNRLDEILEECESYSASAASSSTSASDMATSASETLADMQELYTTATSELETASSTALSNIETASTTATSEIAALAQKLEENIENLADTSLFNLTQTGENKLNYNVFCVNTGEVNDDGESAFLSNVEGRIITSEYSSSGISNFTVDNSIYFDTTDYGTYSFTYDGSDWTLDDAAVSLSDYGITYDEKYSVAEYYTSDTITSCSINSTTFLSMINSTIGTYTFTYSITNSTETETTENDSEETDETDEETEETTTVWTLDETEIDLTAYGITIEGEALDGDTITVTVTSLLSEDDTITVTVTQTYTLTSSGEFDVTTAKGKTYTISDALTLDVTDLEDGTYNVFINPVDMTLSVLSNTLTSDIVFPDDAVDGDYLLNTAKVPYDLQKINTITRETTDEDTEETTTETTTTITTGLNEVYVGTLVIE